MDARTRRGVLGPAGLIGAGALVLARCGQDGGPGTPGTQGTPVTSGGASQKQPLQIGAAVSASGSNGKTGQYQTEAYKLWEEQVNQRGGLLGRPVKLTILDDASDPAT